MSVYIVTGKLRNGKTLVAVGRIRDALRKGLRVVTNLDINLLKMFGVDAKNINLVRIPDKPTIEDFEMIGRGWDGQYDESKFGLLVLDECGTWFNSRNWQDKARKAVNDWFLHSGKLRWHVYLIIQDISILDSQMRDAIGEMLVTCRRLDNLRIPLIGAFVKLIAGVNLTLPRIHRAKVTYADGLLCDVWVYRGNDLFSCYQTDQMFLQNYQHGPHSILPPYYTHGRYKIPLTWSRLMRLTKIYWKRFASPVALATGILLGLSAMMFFNARTIETNLQTRLPAKNNHSSSSQSSSLRSLASTPKNDSTPIQNPENPFSGLKFYYVADFPDGILFEVDYPDRSVLSVKQRDLKALGFTVQRINNSLVKLIFDDQITFAINRPRKPFNQQPLPQTQVASAPTPAK